MIVLAHGGEIRAESTGLGHGAAITFLLPGIAAEGGPGRGGGTATGGSPVAVPRQTAWATAGDASGGKTGRRR